jgi:hypothetical protein
MGEGGAWRKGQSGGRGKGGEEESGWGGGELKGGESKGDKLGKIRNDPLFT